MEKCIDDIKSWMTLNKLKLNDDKTEALIVSSGRKSRSLSFSFLDFITVGCASVPLSDSVKNLGVTFDCHLTMKTHVSNLVRSANFELRRISSLRHLLSTDATKILVSAFVLSRLDYCNSLLFGCRQYLLNKLQKVQNNAARLVLRVSKTFLIFSLTAWERREVSTLRAIWLISLIRRVVTPSEHGYLALPVRASSLCQSRVKMEHNNAEFL